MSEETPTIRLYVLTPDQIVLDERVTSVRFQQPDGWQGILPRHAPYFTRLVSGALMYRLLGDERPHYLVMYDGTLQVQEDEILVLTTVAEPGDDLRELERRMLERQSEADALAFQAHIEFVKVRSALIRALTDLPDAPEAIR